MRQKLNKAKITIDIDEFLENFRYSRDDGEFFRTISHASAKVGDTFGKMVS